MKIHQHLVDEIVQSLIEIFSEGRHADKVVEQNLKFQRKWGARDRRFYAEGVYECVRWWRKLWALANQEPNFDRAQVQVVWAIFAYEKGWLDNPKEWGVSPFRIKDRKEELKAGSRAIRESIPDWMDEMGEAQLGERWPSVISALNQPAPVDLRVNTLKSDVHKLQNALLAEEIETLEIPTSPFGLSLKERKNVFITQPFLSGFFEVQDRASQLVAPLLDPQPGERIADACAGAGGKTLHLAALMKNKGKILALDIHDYKLNELKIRTRRAGVDIVETRVIDSSKVIKRLADSFDRVLLDVPCSGMGVLRRNPDSKWKLNPEEIQKMQSLQKEILGSYSKMVKPGGILVYATCSLLPSENQKQVEAFMGEGWTLLQEIVVLPDEGRGDGFYAAKLKRN